jgi:sugar-specific transcriptional regulator TrmB
MEEKINDLLASIGLSKNERIVYLDLIKYGKSTALEIAKRTSIHRTNTYDALRSLQEKGFINELIDDKKRTFSARKPDTIVDYIMHQKSEIESLLPHFQSIAREGKQDAEVSLAKGTFAFREALLDLLALKKPINVYGASNASINIYGLGFLKEFHARRIKEKVMMRHIYNEDAPDRIKQLNAMKYTAARYLPKEYDTMVSTVVCGPYVLLSMFNTPPYLIILKNEQIADTYNRYFEILWKQASDKKPEKKQKAKMSS